MTDSFNYSSGYLHPIIYVSSFAISKVIYRIFKESIDIIFIERITKLK